ncbi:MAG TPA: hypothetical protein VNM92_15670 [Thermoanaerobaculia bacterium]|nr:hypothetical protein [Thermoanaerobaculia bacterium]
MVTRSVARAILAFAILSTSAGCGSLIPWKGKLPDELNLALLVRKNQLFIESATIASKKGRFLLGTAAPTTILSSDFIKREALTPEEQTSVRLGGRRAVSITPVTSDLQGMGDAILGIDVWKSGSLSIDYNSGLATFSQKTDFVTDDMMVSDFVEAPAVDIVIDGKSSRALIDTTVPDALIVPPSVATGTGANSRANVDVVLAGYLFRNVGVRVAAVPQVRIGNRLLSKFLVAVDYKRKRVGLWRDPRTDSKIE